MDAQHEIYVDRFSCICSDEGKERAEERLAKVIAILEESNKEFPRIFETRTVNGQIQYSVIILDRIIYWNQGWIRSIAGDQWGGLNVEYSLNWLNDDYPDDMTDEELDELPDFEYKLIGRFQFDRTIDGLVEAFLLYEERQQHIDAYLAKESDEGTTQEQDAQVQD